MEAYNRPMAPAQTGAELLDSIRSAMTAGADRDIFGAGGFRRETALFYDPPYENDLDDRLARTLVAYLTPTATLQYRASVWASHTTCRVDFLIDTGCRRVALDHSQTPQNLSAGLVEDNDALMLGSGRIDAVYRVRGTDLAERLFDVLHLIAQWEPALFTPYGRRIFASAASAEAKRAQPGPEHDVARIAYPPSRPSEPIFDDLFSWPEPLDGHVELVIRRLSREIPDRWREQYRRARAVYGLAGRRLHDLQPA